MVWREILGRSLPDADCTRAVLASVRMQAGDRVMVERLDYCLRKMSLIEFQRGENQRLKELSLPQLIGRFEPLIFGMALRPPDNLKDDHAAGGRPYCSSSQNFTPLQSRLSFLSR